MILLTMMMDDVLLLLLINNTINDIVTHCAAGLVGCGRTEKIFCPKSEVWPRAGDE